MNYKGTYIGKGFFMLGCFAMLTQVACNSDSKKEKEISYLPIEVDIVRFDKEFAQASVSDLPRLKEDFPLFFPEQYPDSIWQQKLTDTLQKQLDREVLELFPDENVLRDELRGLFQHISYYFPEFKSPRVYTTTSDVDYRTRVIANDSLLILELDTYLGADHYFYEGIPKFLTKNLIPERIGPDVAALYSKKYVAPPSDRTLLSLMIYYGKILYLNDLWLPNTADEFKMGYTSDEMAWVRNNEIEMWRYFIENELLYSTNAKLVQRFIDPAPFSKFNLEIDNDSPGLVGRWLGWQIVRAYMENKDVSVPQLMTAKANEIFNNSQYKPQK